MKILGSWLAHINVGKPWNVKNVEILKYKQLVDDFNFINIDKQLAMYFVMKYSLIDCPFSKI